MSIVGKTKDILKKMFLEDSLLKALIMPELPVPGLTMMQNWLGGTYDGLSAKAHCFDTIPAMGAITDERAFLSIESNMLQAGKSIHTVILTVGCYATEGKLSLTKPEADSFLSEYDLHGNRVDMISAAVFRFFMIHPEISRTLSIGNILLAAGENPTESFWLDSHCYGRKLRFELRDFGLAPGIKGRVVK